MFAGVHGQGHHFGLRCLGQNLPGCLDPVQIGHVDVHDHQIRLILLNLLDGHLTVAGFSHNDQVFLFGEQVVKPLAENGVVVDEDDSGGQGILLGS